MKKSYQLLGFLFSLLLFNQSSQAQENIVFYAGNAGKESFLDVMQLSDNSFVVCGSASNLDWVPASVPRTLLRPKGINNAQGSNKFGFMLLLASDMQTIKHVVHFPQNAVEDIRFIKTTSLPGQITGDLYISGNTSDSRQNGGGYFLAKLDNNFVYGIPKHLVWAKNIWAEGYMKEGHPWDVDGDGNLTYISGQSHNSFAAAYRLNSDGALSVVDNWRNHFTLSGKNYSGLTAEYKNSAADPIAYSAIFFMKSANCDLRSWTQDDYDALSPDGNGNNKKGKWPMDAFFNSPCDTANPSYKGPGYNGYRTSGTTGYGPSSVAVDRRNGDMYFGMNLKTVLPDGLPDFEPAVFAMDKKGTLRWWSRLYSEIDKNGKTMTSTPDQYIDALAVDYSKPYNDGMLVVGARCHGNNSNNFWSGNAIVANPGASGFQNRFSGSNGNIHISWIGKLMLTDGTLKHATFLAEVPDGNTTFGAPHADPNLDGWPDPNRGWPNVNTTRMVRNAIKVTADGSVCIIATGRRTITTANAFQKMVKYGQGTSSWNQFVRVYAPDLSVPLYSSILTGMWNTTDGSGGANTELMGICKTDKGIAAVGCHTEDKNTPGIAAGNPIPTANVPAWGSATPQGQSAILALFGADKLVNPQDNPYVATVPSPRYPLDTLPGSQVTGTHHTIAHGYLKVYPNPAKDILVVDYDIQQAQTITLTDLSGHVIFTATAQPGAQRASININTLTAGVYLVQVQGKAFRKIEKAVIIK